MAEDMASFVAMSCLKLLLSIFNCCLWVTGVCALGSGIWMLIDLHRYLPLLTGNTTGGDGVVSGLPYTLVVAGCLLVILSSLACCCTMRPQPMLLYTYSFFLLLVLCVTLATGAATYANRAQLAGMFQESLQNGLQQYGINQDQTSAIDTIQSTLRCCGVNSTSDWNVTPYSHSHSTAYPPTCCAHATNIKCIAVYNQGCYKVVTTFIWSHQTLLLGVSAAVAVFQVLGITMACVLAKNSKSPHYVHV